MPNLVKLSYGGLYLDHLILSVKEARALERYYTKKPNAVIHLSAPADQDIALGDLKFSIIEDGTTINAFKKVYPEGLFNVPIYDDVVAAVAPKRKAKEQQEA